MGKKKQTKTITSSDKLAKREEKAKKVYAISKTDNVSGSSLQDESSGFPKVTILPAVEKELIGLILEHKTDQKRLGDISKRLSIKKLTDMYDNLANAGFSQKQIEAAMNSTVVAGGDLISALDWLCLNTSNEDLPEGFSQTLLKEEQKLRPKFDASLQVKEAVKQEDVSSLDSLREKLPVKVEKTQTSKKESMKDWILQYAEYSDEDLDEAEDGDNDPNEKYLELSAKLLDAKGCATQAKHEGNKTKQKELSKKIREMLVQMESLEVEPGFDPAIKFKDTEESSATSQSESSKQSVKRSDGEPQLEGHQPNASTAQASQSEDNDFGLGFDMMEEQAVAAEKPVKVVEKTKLDIRKFEYTRQQWTGKSPKQFLIDWVRKNLPRSGPPKFEKIQFRQKWKCKCKIDRTKDGSPLEVTPDILTENNMEAQHLSAALALYHLCRGQPVHQLLPPPYRDVWLEWRDAENSVKQEIKEKENKPRDQYVVKLLKKIQQESKRSCQDSGKVKDTDSEEMTWEDLAEEEESGSPKKSEKIRIYPRGLDDSALQCLHHDRTLSPAYQSLLETRHKLPVFQHRDKIVDKIRRENVIVIAGETGSGKSTQIPQFILEDAILSGRGSSCHIVCTQPRRISAMSLATRVSQELGEAGPGKTHSLCGYQIRFESKKGPNTKLLYCTTGVLLRQLQEDPEMKNITHLIIDEVHERNVQSDFLLIVVKELLTRGKNLKVILMSATLDSAKFSAYFSHCPVVNIPGRTFPVQVYHVEDIVESVGYVIDEDSRYALRSSQLVEEEKATVEVTKKGGDSSQVDLYWTKDDISRIDLTDLDPDKYSLKTRNVISRLDLKRINMDLIMELLSHINRQEPFCHTEGAVLIFLPGLSDIQELYENLQADRYFSDASRYQILALHSVLSSQDQNLAFATPPKGIRKIVLATNIAETGITIPDVVFVIDTGKAKENRYIEASQMSSLEEVFISQANAKQRQGRAGRVREGFCFRLFTKQMYDKFRAFTLPELLRVPLEELCLNIMKCKFGSPTEFLSRAMDPPQSVVVARALALLRDIGACDSEGTQLTPLGHHLAALPVHVRIGKMLIFASIFGCLEQVAVIAAAMTEKSPFVVPLGKKELANTAKTSMAVASSDHLTVYKAFTGWMEARRKGRQFEQSYCNKNFLKHNTLLDIENIKKDLVKLVTSIGFENVVPVPTRQKGAKTAVLNISSVATSDEGLSLDTVSIVKAVLTAGLYPCVARISSMSAVDAAANPEKMVCLAETSQGIAQVHPSSVNRFLQTNGWLIYHEKVKLSRVYIRDSTLTSAYPLMLFGGDIDVQHTQQNVSVDGWIQFQAKAKTGVIFKELRYLLVDLLQQKLENPAMDLQEDRLIPVIRKLITAEAANPS